MPRRSTVPVLLLASLLVAPWLTAQLKPDEPRPSPPVKEEIDPSNKKLKKIDPDAPETSPSREVKEEIDPLKKKLKKIDLDAPDRTEASGLDLVEAARTARAQVVKSLFQRLAIPFDQASLSMNGDKKMRIQPLPFLITEKARIPEGQKVVPILETGKPGETTQLLPAQMMTIQPYELIALEEVRTFLNQNPRDLTRLEQYQAAETVLASVLRFHQSARQRGLRQERDLINGEPFLRQQLRDVILQQFFELVKLEAHDGALVLARRYYETYTDKADLKKIALPLARLLKQMRDNTTLSRDKIRQVRQKLRDLVERDPTDFADVRAQLQQIATEYVQRAREIESKDRNRYQELLTLAGETWPQLPDLQESIQKALDEYPILLVGVRQMPRYFSPAHACTDSEERALDLLFESLVRPTPDADGNLYHGPGLVLGRPRVVSLGRQFVLPRNVTWSNGQPLTVQDIRFTIRELKEGRLSTGLPRTYGDMLKELYWGGDDPHRFEVLLKQGYLEPLSLMTFKILPDPSVNPLPVDGPEFALHPVGSGPFVYKTSDTSNGRKRVIFAANPHYGNRQGKIGLPRIREIHFIQSEDMLADFKEGRIDLALDLTAGESLRIREQASALKVKVLPTQTNNRRVYFLALNHRVKGLDNVDLRRSLAYAINRELLLDSLFREGQARQIHRAINSLYPAGSWALDPSLNGNGGKDSLDLYDESRARSLAEAAYKKMNLRPGSLSFTLRYPSEEPAVAKAMQEIRDRVKKTTGIELKLQELPPHDLRRDIERNRDYEIAYYHYDYPDNTFWLWPLLTSMEPGNYFNYQNKDIDLEFSEMSSRRDFAFIRDATRRNHVRLTLDMPVIPLWQLDPQIALSEALTTPILDPGTLFSQIDQWKLDRKLR